MSLFKWALASAASTLAAVALGEIGARQFIRSQGFYSRYQPYAQLRLELNREALPDLEGSVLLKVNRDGERGDPSPSPGERVWRALVVGGSAAEGFLLPQERTWAAVAQSILNQPENLPKLGAPRAHIGIVARAILPCAQINLLLQRVLPRYDHLDAVMLMVGASDALSWTEQKMPPVLKDRALPISNVFETHPEGPFGIHPKKTALYRLASDLRRRVRRSEVILPDIGGWLHRVRKMRAEAKVVLDEAPDPTPMLDFFDKHLRATIETAKRASSRVILVRQPWFDKDPTPEELAMFWNFGLGRPYKTQVDTYCSPRLMSHLMNLIDERVVLAAREMGVEQVEVRQALKASKQTYYDELHFTAEAAEVVGRLVADAILKRPAA